MRDCKKYILFVIVLVMLLVSAFLWVKKKNSKVKDKAYYKYDQVVNKNDSEVNEKFKQTEKDKKVNYLINNYKQIFKDTKYKVCVHNGGYYDNFLKCIAKKFSNDQNVFEVIPEKYREIFKEDFYKEVFRNPENLVNIKTSDPIAIDIKKRYIKYLYDHMRITSPSVCNNLPEQQTRQYCRDLFK